MLKLYKENGKGPARFEIGLQHCLTYYKEDVE